MKSFPAALFVAVAPLLAADFQVNGRKFTLPEGFTIEMAAGPEQAPRPISGSLDPEGRLYVTDSSGSNEAPAKQVEHPTHRVLRLTDSQGRGVYEQAVVFADKLAFPEGCLWHDGSVYVGAAPILWKLTDTNHDGVADLREKWWDGGTLTGCANDLHGPYLGPDGYIYWTKGAFAEQNHPRPGRKPVHDRASHILRARPDGSDFDAVMTGGMDNPVEVAFTPDGEALFTSTFIDFSQPGRRDGIAHAVYGGVFGKHNSVIEERRVTRTSPELLPVMTQFGAGAPSGLCRHESSAWGEAYKDNFFASSFNLHKITRHRFSFEGAGYASKDEDFLVSADVDFHPTDVLEDADGSLLVVDTGGWYRICCPSSQLAKPDVLGGVYRIRKTGATGPRLKTGAPPSHHDGPYWVAKQAALRRDAAAGPQLRRDLEAICAHPDAAQLPFARVYAEALGRIGDATAAPALLAASGLAADPWLQHSLIYALIEMDSPQAVRSGLTASDAKTRRAALIALAEMEHGDLKPEEGAAFLSDPAPEVAGAAQWILGRRPDWSAALAGWFRERWLSASPAPREAAALNTAAGMLQGSKEGRTLLGEMAAAEKAQLSTRLAALNVIAEGEFKTPPPEWVTAAASAAQHGPAGDEVWWDGIARANIALATDNRAKAVLHAMGANPATPPSARTTALAGLPGGEAMSDAEFDFLRGQLSPKTPAASRSAAAAALAKAHSSRAQREALLGDLSQADPLTLDRLLGAFDHDMDAALCERFVAALRAAPASRSLSPAQLRPHLAQYPAEARGPAEAFAASLNATAASQAAQLAGLLAELKKLPADPRRGQQLFNSPKAACSACHRIGYVGGEVGPELTSIGEARTEQDLLESIAFPSASFARGYEPSLVRLRDGESINGILKGETGESLEIITGPGPATVVKRADVEEVTPGAVSVMPAGLADALSRQEMADLLTFVKNVRWR